MIYKLLNKLFGWDYIQWENSADARIARVHVDGMGRVWYWQYKSIKAVEIIVDPTKVIWLTCSPDKYFPPSDTKPTNADILKALKRAHRFINTIPHLHNVDGTVDTSEIIESSYKEGSVLLQTIKQLEGVK